MLEPRGPAKHQEQQANKRLVRFCFYTIMKHHAHEFDREDFSSKARCSCLLTSPQKLQEIFRYFSFKFDNKIRYYLRLFLKSSCPYRKWLRQCISPRGAHHRAIFDKNLLNNLSLYDTIKAATMTDSYFALWCASNCGDVEMVSGSGQLAATQN